MKNAAEKINERIIELEALKTILGLLDSNRGLYMKYEIEAESGEYHYRDYTPGEILDNPYVENEVKCKELLDEVIAYLIKKYI